MKHYNQQKALCLFCITGSITELISLRIVTLPLYKGLNFTHKILFYLSHHISVGKRHSDAFLIRLINSYK